MEMILSVRMRNRKLRNIRPSGALGIPLKLEVGGVLYDVRVYRFPALVICPFPAILFSYFIIYFNNGFHLQCFRIYSLCTPSSLSRPRSLAAAAAALLLLPLYMYIQCFSELRRIILEFFFLLETMQVGIKFTISFI
jgi:hypothetical protein